MRLNFSQKVTPDPEWNFAADQNQSYTTLFSHQRGRKQNQVSLFRQWIPTKRIIKNFIYSFNQYLSRQWRQKYLLALLTSE
jgi:type II secretory pathway component PulL